MRALLHKGAHRILGSMPFAARTITCLLLAVAGCGQSATEGGFDAANPAARMYATEQAARAGDTSAIERIVEQLDSDDPATRWLAIRSLEHLTGRTNGYDYTDPPAERREAINRWRDDLATGRIVAEDAVNG